jgi:hypothetical protein
VAKIAARLRSTGWTGTLGSFPSEYSETAGTRRDLSGAHRYRPFTLDPMVCFSAARLPGRPGHEGRLRVDLTR